MKKTNQKKNRAGLRAACLCVLLAGCIVMLASCAAQNAAEDRTAISKPMAENSGGMKGTSAELFYSASMDSEMEYVKDESYAADTMAPSETAPSGKEPGESGSIPADSSRKLIRNVTMEVETKEFDAFRHSLEARISACGGYTQSSSMRGSGSRRYMSAVVRIPADRLDEFCSGISDISNVIMRSDNTRDVTLSYYDMESHIKALRSEYDTLISILEKCTQLTDVITVQSRITEVLYQIESYQSQLNNYDSLVAYSTVEIYVSEVERETVVSEQTVGERISTGLSRTMEEITEKAQDIVVDLTVNLPYILIWAVILSAAALCARLLFRRARRKKNNANTLTGYTEYRDENSGDKKE